MILARSALLVVSIAVFACSDDGAGADGGLREDVFHLDAEPSDRGFVDSGSLDAAVMDAVAMDAVSMDAVAMDAVSMDAVAMDAVAMDAVAMDAVAMDAVVMDAIAMDAVAMDAVAPDAVAPDAVAPDADPIDVGFPDAPAPDATPPDSGVSEFAPVYAIINANCSCHDFGSGGLTMNNPTNAYNNLVNTPSFACPNQDRVEPGDATMSAIAHKIGPNHVAEGCGGSRMPASGPPYLSAQDIQTIVDWINAGANP